MPRKRGSAAAGISDFQGIGGRIAEGGFMNLKPEELVKALAEMEGKKDGV